MSLTLLLTIALVVGAPKKTKKPTKAAPHEEPTPNPETDAPGIGAYKYEPEAAPQPPPPKTEPVVVAAPDPRKAGGPFLGVHLRGSGVVPGVIVARIQPGLELGYRFPQLDGFFGVSISAAYVFAVASPSGTAHGIAGALRGLIFVPAGPGILRFALGPTLNWVRLATVLPDSGARVDFTGSVGVEVSAGYYFLLPKGLLGVNLTYGLVPYLSARAVTLGNALGGEVAYAYFF